jgi:hypothetical protein
MPNVRWKDDPAEYYKQYRKENKSRYRDYQRDRYRKNIDKERSRCVAKNRQLKLNAIAAYGGACKGCGIANPDLLCFDHVNDDGAEKRRNGQGTGIKLMNELKRNGWPKDIQLLCHNCNHLKKIGKLSYVQALGVNT